MPFTPISLGPSGAAEEEEGKVLRGAKKTLPLRFLFEKYARLPALDGAFAPHKDAPFL